MDLATFALLLSNLTAIANVEGDSNVYITAKTEVEISRHSGVKIPL